MKINVGDFPIGDNEINAVLNVLKSGRITEGKVTAEFEKEWASYVGTKYSVLVNSGTSALIAALTALKYKHKLPDGTKILVSPVTYIATINAIVLTGFEPVFVDIDKTDYSLDTSKIEAAVKDDPKIRIILPVHLMGFMNDMDLLKNICETYNLILFEDAAQAHGSLYKNKRAGSFGDISDFSFYIAHNVQAGELGAINTDDAILYKLVKKIKSNGRFCDCSYCVRSSGKCPKLPILMEKYPNKDYDAKFLHDIWGYNFRTMDIQASLALSQLQNIDSILKKRQHAVKSLNHGLKKYSHIIQLPKYDENVSYLAYPMLIKDNSALDRRTFRTELEKQSIETRPLFGCIPTQQPSFSYLKEKYQSSLPNANYVGENGLYIGCHQYLSSEDIKYIINSVSSILEKVD